MGMNFRSGKPKLGEKTFASEARAQLGVLIAERHAKSATKAQQEAAMAEADERLAACQQAAVDAGKAVEAAKAEVTAALMAGTPARYDAVRLAQNALDDAEGTLEIMRGVKNRLLAQHEAAGHAFGVGYNEEFSDRLHSDRMRDAAIRVIIEHPSRATLLSEVLAAEQQYLRVAAKLHWFMDHGVVNTLEPGEAADWKHANERVEVALNWIFFDDDRTARLRDGDTKPPDWDGRPRVRGWHLMRPAVDSLNDAYAALHEDANASLPNIL